MKALQFLLLLLVFQISPIAAQRRIIDKETWKMGYVNSAGDTIIHPEYDFLPRKFESKMVARKGKWRGVIDSTGKVIVPFQYATIRPEKHGFYAVTKDFGNKPMQYEVVNLAWGLLDSLGQTVFPLTAQYVAVVDTHLLALRYFNSTDLKLFDAKGNLRCVLKGDMAMPGFDANTVLIQRANRTCYWADLGGNTITPSLFDKVSWSDGTWFRAERSMYGILNAQGDTVVPFIYRGCVPKNKGHFLLSDSSYNDFLYNVINHTSVAGTFVRIGNDAEGEAYVKPSNIGEKTIILAPDGQTILFDKCQNYPLLTSGNCNRRLECFEEKYTWVVTKGSNERKGLYDSKGKEILPPRFEKIEYYSDRHLLLGAIWDRKTNFYDTGIYDFEGKQVIPDRFAEMKFTDDPRVFIGRKVLNGPLGFIDIRNPGKAIFSYKHINYHTDSTWRASTEQGQNVYLTMTGAPFQLKERVVSEEAVPVVAPAGNRDLTEVFNEHELEQPPVFPGGKTGLDSYIAANLKYPTIARENNIQGTVVVAFVVDELGRVVHPKLLRDISNGCGQAALQVVKTMPNWSAGMSQGQAVKTRIVLPVKFSLE